ncbi:MAG: phage tail fiber protein [Brevundimonas sp.]
MAYFATTGQQEFDFAHPYIHRDHVSVTVNGQIAAKTWVTGSTIRLSRPCQAQDAVKIIRETPVDGPIVKFQNGNVLTEEELNLAVRQLLFICQEMLDLYGAGLGEGMIRVGDRMNIPTTGDEIIDQIISMALADQLLAEFRQRISDIDLNAEAIIQQALQITGLSGQVNNVWQAQANAANVVSSLRSDFDGLVSVVDALANVGDGTGIATVIQNEANARIQADNAIVDTLSLIGAANGPRTAFTLNFNTLMANATATMNQYMRAISAQADANSRTIFAEQIIATSNAISAQGQTISGLSTNVAGVRADLINEANLRSTADVATAGTLALLGANASGNQSFILNQATTRVSPTETLGSRLATISANAGTLTALINEEATARVANGVSLASQINQMATRVDGANAAIAAQSTAISTANSAQTAARQAQVSQLQSGLNSANSAISQEASTRSTANSAQTAAREAMASTFTAGLNSANAAIQQEASTRSQADGAMAATLAIMGVQAGGGSTFILNENSVYVNGTTTLGTFRSGIDSRFGQQSAAIIATNQALATANSVSASAIQGVVASLNGANASITNLQQVVSGPGGLMTRAGLVLNNNNHVIGWSLNNNGLTGGFNVVADDFGFTAPGGGAPVKVFEMNAGKVRFNANTEIFGDLIVTGSINGNRMVENTITGVAGAYDAATITLTGSTPMRVQGVWLNIEKTTSPIDIDFNCFALWRHDAGGSFTAFAQLVRSRGLTGGTVLLSIPIFGSGMANDTWQGAIPIRYLDRPGETGNWHYYVQIFTNVSNMTVQSVSSRYGMVTELKTNNVTIGTGTGAGSGTGGSGDTGGGGGGGGDLPPYDPPGGGGIYPDQPTIDP